MESHFVGTVVVAEVLELAAPIVDTTVVQVAVNIVDFAQLPLVLVVPIEDTTVAPAVVDIAAVVLAAVTTADMTQPSLAVNADH